MFDRKLPRLQGYDYATENYYYVTVCTHDKKCIFRDGEKLSRFGLIAISELLEIPNRFVGVKLDKFVIMPNHIHAIVVLGCETDKERSRPFPTLSTVIGLYKSGVTKRIHALCPDFCVWQKSFYDHIIRTEQGYLEICRYIEENPLKWELDKLYVK